LRYSRRGLVAYLGHLDVMGLWIQAVRRSSLPVAYSMGFHPKARMGMGPACPVGVSSSVEYIDLELERKVDPARAVSMLNAFLVDGLEAIEAYYVPRGTPSLSAGIAFIDYRFVFEEPGTAGEAGARLAGFMALESLMVRRTKEGRTREHDLRKLLLDGRMDECGAAVVRAANTPSGGARISEIFEHALGLSESGRMRVSVERTQVGFGRPDGR
jgi:radical SAM-linked protein